MTRLALKGRRPQGTSDEREMRRFWDLRARENALFFVDNRLDYASPDRDLFFENGRNTLEDMLERLDASIEPTDDVVEIGCGAGRQTRAIASRAKSVQAVDVSGEMLAVAEELNPDLRNVAWVLGDGTSLAGIADQSADVCLSYVVFQHIPDPAVTLGYVRDIGRVLRPGGWAAFQVSNDPHVHRRRSFRERLPVLAAALRRRGPRGQQHPAWLGTAVEMETLRSTATDVGLEIVRTVGEGTQFCLVKARRAR